MSQRFSGASRRGVVTVGTVLTVAVSLLLVGCQASPSSQQQSAGRSDFSSASASPSATAVPEPALSLDGTAADNLAFFNAVNGKLVAKNSAATGPDFVAALVEAGFDKTAMQMTADITTVGVEADSVFVSVQWGQSCLVAQYGVGGYLGAVVKTVNGSCLIGQTVPIP